MELLNTLYAPVGQVLNSPACILVVLGLSVIAYVLELWPKFNSRFVPIVCILGGPVFYPLFASRASVPPTFPNPLAVLIVNGLIAGFIAAVLHKKLVLALMKRFGQFDTTFTTNPKPPETKP